MKFVANTELVVCWGEVLWDMFPDEPRLGGAPANVAHHLAKLGRKVALVSRVGDDELGRRALASMRAAGIIVDGVQVDAHRPTGYVEVTISRKEPSYQLAGGCAWEEIQLDAEAEALLRRGSALCFGTLSQRSPMGREELARALAAAPPGCLKVCDPNLRPSHLDEQVLRASLATADLVKLNAREAAIVGEHIQPSDPVRWLLEETGALWVAVTRGEHGSVVFSRQDRHEHPGFPAAPGGDNVGAGDAFLAALIDRTLRKTPLAAANAAANRYASLVASRKGATPDIARALVDDLDR